QLLHIDTQGKVLARFSPPDKAHHGFNDLVVLKSGEVFTTDSLGNAVFRFDAPARKFTTLQFHRPLFYPNGIALAGDEHTIYVADPLRVLKYDLANSSSTDVTTDPNATLTGVQFLYGHPGILVEIRKANDRP